MIRRSIVAGLAVFGIMLTALPSPVAACSWASPSLAAAAASVDAIFVGTVEEVPAPQTYRIAVDRVFKGSPPAEMTFLPNPGDALTTCVVLEEGGRYVFGTDRFDGPLGIDQAWYRLDGPAVRGEYLLNWPGSADELFAALAALPDTAMAHPHLDAARRAVPTAALGVLLLGLAAGLALAGGGRRRRAC